MPLAVCSDREDLNKFREWVETRYRINTESSKEHSFGEYECHDSIQGSLKTGTCHARLTQYQPKGVCIVIIIITIIKDLMIVKNPRNG